jgi:SAM-dependent methyltransferase
MNAHALDRLPTEKGVLMAEASVPFGPIYHGARSQEGRVLEDELLRQLPGTLPTIHRDEWLVRVRSAKRLLNHLHGFGRPLDVLDVGCGNGWLSALLARDGHTVLGIDRNLVELHQAARVFPSGPRFAMSDLFNRALDALRFDVVLFAASFHYFADARSTLHRARMLAPAGEVHVMDSVLYPDQKAAGEARARSLAYYTSLGVPELAAHYHAHTLAEIRKAGPHVILRRPGGLNGLIDRLHGLHDPFHHVVLRTG